jgi:hypothetical protein
MLKIPSKGFSRSVTRHNVDIGLCCDWLEASALFLQENFTATDVVDVLRENEVYATQEFAWQFIEDVFQHLRVRAKVFGEGYPITPVDHRIELRGTVQEFSAYAFCLALSLPPFYPEWARAFGANFNAQGELFERLTAESVQASLSGWDVHTTGWSRTNTTNLTAVVKHVAGLLGESTGDIARWSKAKAKEAGLDLLCFRAFPDGRVGVPVYMVQCASGADWMEKLNTPDLNIWTKLISFAAKPKKAFAMPFALDDDDFIYRTAIVNGLLLDRHRLLAPGQAQRDWISAALSNDLVAWVTPRVAALPNEAVAV